MGITWLVLVIGGVALVGSFIGVVVLLVLLILRQAGKSRGWASLLEQYAVDQPPAVQWLDGQTVKCGAVTFKRCVALASEPAGLYLRINHREVLIPWSEVQQVTTTTLYWQTAYVLHIGAPESATVCLPAKLFDVVRPNLSSHLAKAS